jgi:hypothetical protein
MCGYGLLKWGKRTERKTEAGEASAGGKIELEKRKDFVKSIPNFGASAY